MRSVEQLISPFRPTATVPVIDMYGFLRSVSGLSVTLHDAAPVEILDGVYETCRTNDG